MCVKKIFFFISIFFACNCAFASIVITNGLTHTHNVKEGTVYKGVITVENTAETSQNVKLYQKDYSYKADGTSHYNDPGLNERSNLQWIKLNTNLLKLEAKGKVDVPYEIVVPTNIDAGSYWSVIMVEPVEDLKPDDSKQGVSITSVIRYAIQVITDYNADKAKPDLKFESIKIENEEGFRTAQIAIANNGNLYCKPTASLEIYNRKTGEKIGTFSSIAMGLLPHTSKKFSIALNTLTPDKYNAVIIATDENENAFALNVELEVKND